MIKKISHIAIIVSDLESSLAFWRDTLGLPLSRTEEVALQESIVAFLPAGEGEVELVQPTTDTSGAARFLARRGPGLHHIALEVDNLDEMLARLKAKGVRLINETPIAAAGGNRAAFIHPESANGVLVELYEAPRQ
ncbi:MAG: methylmalonyl-CoA epimerase [Chloroflexi bacterium]|nr:methylmalonyl-CoA epimerase [Chloroflexota bacterium]